MADETPLTLKDTLHRLVDLARWPSEAEMLTHRAAIEAEFPAPVPTVVEPPA